MKKILILICLTFIPYLSLKSCDDRNVEDKLAHQIIYDVSKILERRYQLNYIGMVEAGETNYYTKIGIEFQIFHIVDKSEGRKILVDSAKELLKAINSNDKLLAHLQTSPFTLSNIEILIYVYHSDKTIAHDEDIKVFGVKDGVLKYWKKTPREGYEFGYYVEETESYEEALKILEAQNKSP